VVKDAAAFYFYNAGGAQLGTTTFAAFNADAKTTFERGQGNIIYGFNGSQETAKIDSGAYTVGATAIVRPSGIGV
jgi:hypothetical protein